ncbi:hypothetical protein ACJMK2_028401 [Sinanodonta woodiana]|uniref:Uncharacterized protein n=1 Tax=Sinanodonta woodiana TaxID=1069815 RepID=A0ABD3X7B6_SINWO
MSIQYDQLRADLEVNRTLQNVIVVHHIIQVVCLVVGIIICGATSNIILMLIHLLPILPAFIFAIFLIASQCSFQNLRHILVHFNFILSMLWFMTVFPICIISSIVFYPYSRAINTVPAVVAILNGILSFSSVSFAVCAIWKAARNVAINVKLATLQHDHGRSISALPYDTLNTYSNQNGIQMPQATYDLPMWTPQKW